MLTKEYYSQQTGLEKRIAELEAQLAEKEGRLQTYERMEKELDDVVMQAAEGRKACIAGYKLRADFDCDKLIHVHVRLRLTVTV